MEGSGYGIVCCVGVNSHLGKLNSKLQEKPNESTILNKNLANLAKLMVTCGCVMASIMFIVLTSYFA